MQPTSEETTFINSDRSIGLNINTIMNKKIKELLERLHEEGHINNSEYNMLMSLNSKVVVTRYSLDNVNTTWEPFTKIIIPESKL